MKNLQLALLFLFSIVIVSCGAVEEPISTVRIDGAWTLDQATGTGQNITYYNGTPYPAEFSMRTVAPTEYTLTFTPQGKLYSTGSFTEEITGTFQGQSTTRVVDKSNIVGSGYWKLQGKQLNMGTDSPEEISMRVLLHTETDLTLEYHRSFTTTKNGNRVEEEQTITYFLIRRNS